MATATARSTLSHSISSKSLPCRRMAMDISKRGKMQVCTAHSFDSRFEPFLKLHSLMSAVDHDGPDDHPRPAPVNLPPQPPQGESTFADSSGPLFSMYSKIAEEEDNKMTERWQKDADALLIFVGLHIQVHTLNPSTGTLHRLVYSLLLSRRYSPCQSRI
jgi:Family of unknown function (DUF6535)